ncbi:MAG: histidine ammonia-lyase [Phycisphaerales bacterium]|nr:histidine ammonia-lyase [Phycisphaerales bacterium]
MGAQLKTMTPFRLTVGADALDWPALDAALGRPLQIALAEAGLRRVRDCRAKVDALRGRDEPIYGVNTGFGHLKNKRIPADRLEQLQHNLLISHAVGVGPETPAAIVRWMLLFKINMLLRGHSGVRTELVDRLVAWLNADALPVVPTRGSLGASGDLAPLAHLALPLIGRGEMVSPLGRMASLETHRRLKLGEPLALASKEGLALINGTQFMSAYAANICVRAARLLDLADLTLCMSLEGQLGSVRPMDARLHAARPHPGAIYVAEKVRRHMRDSEILGSHAQCGKVQDPYSLRCAPQVHGAVRDAFEHGRAVVGREINSVTDNPLIFDDDFISGGAFHGAPLAGVMDYLAIALTDLASISERRTYLLLLGQDDLPTLLMRDTGVNSGFMIPQYTAAALVNECKVLATPASVDTIPTSLGQEDHVSMGATAALKLYEVIDRAETVLAIEMLCAAQAMDYRDPLRPGAGPAAARDVIRATIPHAEEDREFGADIQTCLKLLRESEPLRRVARGEA